MNTLGKATFYLFYYHYLLYFAPLRHKGVRQAVYKVWDLHQYSEGRMLILLFLNRLRE